jgi:tetratricopeptide (TPR) repeat protein
MSRNLLIAALILALANTSTSYAQKKDFRKRYSQTEDPKKQEQLLKEWAAADKNDAELYAAYAQFYMMQNQSEVLVVEPDSSNSEGALIHGPVDYKGIEQAKESLLKGLALHPERLDLRFSYIRLLSLEGNYPLVVIAVEEALVLDQQRKHVWFWSMDEPVKDDRFLAAIQDYAAMAFEVEDYESVRKIGEAVLKFYPNNVESLSNVGISYLVKEQYDIALNYFLKAQQLNNKDIVVLNNIAEVYRRKHDNPNAKKYYEEMVKIGQQEDIDYAKSKIAELK